MQISKRTKYKFGEFATEFAVLRQIDDVFVAEDFEPVENYSGLASGMRRSLVADTTPRSTSPTLRSSGA